MPSTFSRERESQVLAAWVAQASARRLGLWCLRLWFLRSSEHLAPCFGQQSSQSSLVESQLKSGVRWVIGQLDVNDLVVLHSFKHHLTTTPTPSVVRHRSNLRPAALNRVPDVRVRPLPVSNDFCLAVTSTGQGERLLFLHFQASGDCLARDGLGGNLDLVCLKHLSAGRPVRVGRPDTDHAVAAPTDKVPVGQLSDAPDASWVRQRGQTLSTVPDFQGFVLPARDKLGTRCDVQRVGVALVRGYYLQALAAQSPKPDSAIIGS
mmetsp:Transcript_25266/g.58208  ORF Transcript_25266/g.58208 Transcript_25266/m.58208 type:complete len:264 (+) Transcript_25266:194-985(+)